MLGLPTHLAAGEPDAHCGAQSAAADVDRPFHRGDERRRHGLHLGPPEVLPDRDELVAAEAEHVVAEHGPQPCADLDEELVASLVPEPVVHRLEVVHVDVEHRHPRGRPPVERAPEVHQ